MSVLTREISAAAASSPRHLTAGTVADPVRLTWREGHEQAKRMAGGLAARAIGRHGSVAVLATALISRIVAVSKSRKLMAASSPA